jgi:predicted permease
MRRPGFTALVVLTLGIGIGANTAIFSLVDGILLRPLAVSNPDEIVIIDSVASRLARFGDTSYLDFVDLSRQSKSFAGMIASSRLSFSMNPVVTGDARPEIVWGLIVSGNYFSVFGVKAAIGRTFGPEDDQVPGRAPVAVLSHALWERSFGSDPEIAGKSIKLNGRLFTVVGVAPKSFTGSDLSYQPDIYVPTMMSGDVAPAGKRVLEGRDYRMFSVFGRLRPNVTVAQAQAEMTLVAKELSREYPTTDKDLNFLVRRELEYRMEGSGFVLPLVLMGLVVLVLLIACANVVSLLMARGAARLGEIATQLALGATRARLMRQLLTECAVLAFWGGVCGIAMGYAGIRAARSLVPYSPAPQGPVFRLDGRVLLYTLVASAATVLICGVLPALMATGEAARAALRTRVSNVSGLSLGAVARQIVVVAQVAFSVIMLTASGTFVRAFTTLERFDLGFNPEHVLVVGMNPSFYGYSKEQTAEFYKEILRRTTTLPGIQSASLAAVPPFLGAYSWDISIDGYLAPNGDQFVDTLTSRVTSGYFETLQIPFLKGRNFTETDTADAPRVAIVNEMFARRFMAGKDDISQALGRVFRHRDGVPIRIVGIVKNSTYGGVTPLGAPPAPVFYTPVLQNSDTYLALLTRAKGDPSELASPIRQEIHSLDSEMAPVYLLPLSAVVSARALYMPRVASMLSGVFAIIALVLTLVGLYGVVSFIVERRTQEIGIRIALGAQRSRVLTMILNSSLSLVAAGLVIGVAAALATTPLISRLLSGAANSRDPITFLAGVNPRDPITFILLPGLMFVATVVASLIPASRAVHVEPAKALRYE